MNLKEELFQILWSDFKVNDFENWLFKQNSIDFENLLGEDNYLDIISEDFSRESVDNIKRYVYSKFNTSLKSDWEDFINQNYVPLIGICKTAKALDYYKSETRDWDLKIGKKYEILEVVISSTNNDNHKQYVRYVDRENNLYPSGYVPLELFEIDLQNISDKYFYREIDELIEIHPKNWNENTYKPEIYSFWEDFYDDEPKAVGTYYDTLEELGIKNAW